jgi:hypothetical protein
VERGDEIARLAPWFIRLDPASCRQKELLSSAHGPSRYFSQKKPRASFRIAERLYEKSFEKIIDKYLSTMVGYTANGER